MTDLRLDNGGSATAAAVPEKLAVRRQKQQALHDDKRLHMLDGRCSPKATRHASHM